jgi:hypothetical protein
MMVAGVVTAACLLVACGSKKPPPRAASSSQVAPPRDVLERSTIDLQAFWSTWFASPYEYMFGAPEGRGWSNAPKLADEGMVFGSGISGFYFYGGLDDCIRAHLGQEVEYGHDDYASVVALSGRPFKIGEIGEGWDRGFGRYDPATIDWALRTLVPHPNQPFAGRSFQHVYDATFFRVVRLHALAYIDLNTRLDLERESKAYLQAMSKEPDFYGVEWLQRRYSSALANAYPLDQDGTLLTAPMVLGFWLRRHVDGTETSLVTALGVILRAYDRDFVTRNAAHMHLFGGV